jgi:hypothetical protein
VVAREKSAKIGIGGKKKGMKRAGEGLKPTTCDG